MPTRSCRRSRSIMLSARAGEEARLEGLAASADDYLVKPFSARDLIARVDAQLVKARARDLEQRHAARMTSLFSHAPVAIAVLRGPDHVYELANPRYRDLVGGREVVGQPIREALPELADRASTSCSTPCGPRRAVRRPVVRVELNRGPGLRARGVLLRFRLPADVRCGRPRRHHRRHRATTSPAWPRPSARRRRPTA